MEFNKRLRRLRKERDLTQEELARELGLTPAAIGLYEQNRREPDNDIVKRIASFFEVSIDYLLGFDTPDSQSADISYDEFTYAMHNEIKNLSDEEKAAILSMVKTFKQTLGK